MEYMELSVIQSLLERTPSHSCDLMETSNCHSGRCFCSKWVQIYIFEFMYSDFIKTKGSSYSFLFNNYIQGGQVLCTCNHAIVFRVLLHTDCVIYIFFFRKFLNSIYFCFLKIRTCFMILAKNGSYLKGA